MSRVLLAVAALAFVAFLAFVSAGEDTAAFFDLLGEPWMKVVLADFYLGILCFAVIVRVVEGSLLRACAWGLATAVLGNPVAAVWLIVRGLPRLRSAAPTAP